MAALDAVCLPNLTPWELIGLQFHFLDSVKAGRCPPILILYQQAERIVSIGRYHLYGGPEERGRVTAMRRLTGGRICAAGGGWLGCSLILPSRDALLKDASIALKPDQVMNRYVRGVLTGLRSLGLDCFYPGRDAITLERREIGMCSLETDAQGAMLMEVFLAVSRGMESLPHDLESFDPEGALTCPMYSPEIATTIERELRREIPISSLSEAIIAGYDSQFGGTNRRDLTAEEHADAIRRAREFTASGWLTSRNPPPYQGWASGDFFEKVARMGSQLGFIEAHLRLGPDGQIRKLMMGGDFIANSPGVEQFENEVVGKSLDLVALSQVSIKVFGDGSNYFLGIGDLVNLPKLVMKAE